MLSLHYLSFPGIRVAFALVYFIQDFLVGVISNILFICFPQKTLVVLWKIGFVEE